MIEKLLLGIGMQCGSTKNFNTKILEAMRKGEPQMWYFLTPVKSSDNGSGYFEAKINLGFPILSIKSDLTEAIALERIASTQKEETAELLRVLKKYINVPAATFVQIPFWANNENERTERKDFANIRVHLIKAQLTVKYRENWFSCTC